MPSSPPVVRLLVRKPGPKRASPSRLAAPVPIPVRSAGTGGRRPVAGPGPARPRTLLLGAVRAWQALCVRFRGRDPMSHAGPATAQADLVEARLMSDHWRHRAEAAEARAGELEMRLAAAEMAALELRSRIICLQGKLATTTATARYHTLALALEHDRPALDKVGGPV